MLIMVEKGIRDGIGHVIHQYMEANNKHINDYDKNEESSYLMYWNRKNLYGWTMPRNLSFGDFT